MLRARSHKEGQTGEFSGRQGLRKAGLVTAADVVLDTRRMGRVAICQRSLLKGDFREQHGTGLNVL